MYVERGSGGDLEIDEAGEWQHRIDTAFACLSVDNSEFSRWYPDVLIAGGIGNDGLVCKVGAWPAEYSYDASYPDASQLTDVESIANWTPMTDMTVEHLSDSRTPHRDHRSSILIANGLNPHGEISELRHGVQSFIDDSFGGMNGCSGLWVLDYGSHTVEIEGKAARQHWATFAITLAPETLVIRIIRTQRESRGEFSGAWEDRTWDKTQLPSDDEPSDDGVMRDVETITACPWSEQFAIQVTRSEARILRRPTLQQTDSVIYNSSLLLAASIPGSPVIAVTYRDAGNTYLETLLISHDGTFVKDASKKNTHLLDHDPTCVELVDLDGSIYVFASTFGAKILLFGVQENGDITLVWEDNLPNASPGGDRILLENAVVLSVEGQHLLVCATRSGYLLSSPFTTDELGTTPFDWKTVKMGETSTRLKASVTDTSTAFASCGGDFCRVRVSASANSRIDVDSIWFTNRANPGYLQAPVTAMYQLPFIHDPNAVGRNLGGFLFAVAGDQLLFSQLDSDIRWTNEVAPASQDQCRAVPRKVVLGPKPTNMLYLKAFRKMVVSTMEAKEERAPPNGVRSLHSSIQLLNIHDDKPLDELDIKQEDYEGSVNHLVSAEFPLQRGERVYSIVEWPFVDHRRKKYTLIIVGTGVPDSNGKETGRKLILSPGKSGSKLQLQKDFDFDHPVYCVAVHDNASTISAIGRKLTLDVFDSEAGKMHTKATQELPSPGTHITAKGNFVYVSTPQHSHLCYELKTPTRHDGFEFHQVFADSHERNCAPHLTIPITLEPNTASSPDTLVLVTDKSSASITGLYQPRERTYKKTADTVFEACLPHTVVRLSKGDIRPPWRRPADASQLQATGILTEDIIGACSDGTIYSFSILSAPARHLLRYLQNIIEEKARKDPANHDALAKPRSGAIHDILMNGADGAQDDVIHAHPLNPMNTERSAAGPRWNHIDGDLLKRWNDEDGDVGRLVSEGTDADVGRLLVEFVKEVWSTEEGVDEWNEEKVVTKVQDWIGEVLTPLL